jgi:hypothetical protein
MAKYSDIKGFTVQTVTSDPGATQFAAGSWASDATAPQTTQSAGSFGTSTAAVSSGGYDGSSYIQTTIEFNGSAWTSGGSMNRPGGQSFPGFGTESSGGIAGGYKTSGNAVVNNFESYNGTAFTESTDLNSARQNGGATGASATAGIVVGGTTGVGSPPDTTGNNNVEIWNGTSWTEISEINTARYSMRALGSTCPAPTAVVAGGENSGTKTGVTEKYDGSSWSESGDLNTARSQHGGAGNVATSGICFGGEGSAPSYTNYALTEHFDGSTWTEVSDLSGTRNSFGTQTGTASAAIAAQGRNPGFTGLTEIWSAPSTFQKTIEGQLFFNSTANAFKETIKDVATGTWSSGGSLNTGRSLLGGAGTNTAGIVFGGYRPAYHAVTETYDGTSFTEVNDMNTARYNLGSASAGTQTSALGYGGSKSPSNAQTGETETWNGSSWTEVNDMNVAKGQLSSIGVQTSALAAGGTNGSSYYDTNESWNGTSWTEVGDLNTVRYAFGSSGVSNTSGLVFGGVPYTGSPPDGMPLTELWNGSTWTEVNDLNTGRAANAGAGTSTQGICYAGNPSNPNNALTELWNGTSWTEIADLATGRNGTSPSGSAVAAFAAGTEAAPTNTVTENFTGALTNKTITTS